MENLTDNELRVIVALRVIAAHLSETGGAPLQRELVGVGGLLQQEWERLSIDVEFPWGFRTPAQLYKAVTMLRNVGLMTYAKGYHVSEEGIAVAKTFNDEWKSWERDLLEVVSDDA